jgi:hypothetical protein
MDREQANPDHLKSLADIFSLDPRSDNQSVLDLLHKGAVAIEKHHADVASVRLAAFVPESVTARFETAKNLYLYAWFVYRFFPVAEFHALTTLEYGLKLRFPDPLPKKYWDKPNSWKPPLGALLGYAIDTGAIKNEGFRQWHNQVEFRARERYFNERLVEFEQGNLDHIEIDYREAIPKDEDQNWDYLSILRETLPKTRNSYAHGSTGLHRQVLGALEMVSEILNQLFGSGEEAKA